MLNNVLCEFILLHLFMVFKNELKSITISLYKMQKLCHADYIWYKDLNA